ncbi:MAG: flagellar protein FlgN [Syntrophomonadaceae bacterium]|nr:flagellar protein FlgN [Syntrophomonadaceae bacterium]
MVENLLKDFISAVGKENEVLANLAEIGEQKRQYIILGEIKQLDSLIQREGIVLTNLERLEGARFKLQQELAKKWGLPIGELVATEMLKIVKEQHGNYYTELSQSIEQLDYNLTRLKAITQNNHGLLEQSLEFISTMESMIEGDVAGTYSDSGDKIDESLLRVNRNLLDKKI